MIAGVMDSPSKRDNFLGAIIPPSSIPFMLPNHFRKRLIPLALGILSAAGGLSLRGTAEEPAPAVSDWLRQPLLPRNLGCDSAGSALCDDNAVARANRLFL